MNQLDLFGDKTTAGPGRDLPLKSTIKRLSEMGVPAEQIRSMSRGQAFAVLSEMEKKAKATKTKAATRKLKDAEPERFATPTTPPPEVLSARTRPDVSLREAITLPATVMELQAVLDDPLADPERLTFDVAGAVKELPNKMLRELGEWLIGYFVGRLATLPRSVASVGVRIAAGECATPEPVPAGSEGGDSVDYPDFGEPPDSGEHAPEWEYDLRDV